jgi:hypothetical protein
MMFNEFGENCEIHDSPLLDAEVIKRGEVYFMTVAHDDWCEFYSGKGPVCDCKPDVTVTCGTGEVLNQK